MGIYVIRIVITIVIIVVIIVVMIIVVIINKCLYRIHMQVWKKGSTVVLAVAVGVSGRRWQVTACLVHALSPR